MKPLPGKLLSDLTPKPLKPRLHKALSHFNRYIPTGLVLWANGGWGTTDILAFSRDGRGGNITLRTPVFYGFQYKPAPPGVDPTTLRGNGKVDINASGRLSAGIIALPDIGKLQNTVVQLPAAPVDTDSLIANSCIVQRAHQGSLMITGAGGIPTQPDDLASVPFSTYELAPLPADRSSTVANPAIAEADGIYRLSTGEIFLGLRCN